MKTRTKKVLTGTAIFTLRMIMFALWIILYVNLIEKSLWWALSIPVVVILAITTDILIDEIEYFIKRRKKE